MMPRSDHVRMVLMLYKGILKVHRGLPVECRALGDEYVKDEFKRHKDVGQAESVRFLEEWTNYYLTLAKQMGKRSVKQELGQNMTEQQIDAFKDEQIEQLYELQQAATSKDSDNEPAGGTTKT